MSPSVVALLVALSLPLTSVPRIGLASVSAFAQEAKAPAPTTPTVNVNAATAPQFEALPGIGPSMAQRIVSFREKNGPFKKLEDLMNVQGIGEKSFLKLRPYLTLGGGDAKAGK